MNDSASIKIETKKSFLPDVSDIIFFVILFLILIVKENILLTDGSTGWHLVTGNFILQNHHVPVIDLMSHTFANKPWVAYEWLSDLIMAVLVKLGGLNLLTVAVAAAIAYLMQLLYARCRENGCNFAFAGIVTILGACVSAIHWLARPHIWTFFGVYIFATQLDRYYHGLISKTRLAIYLTLYMLFWANTHPAFPLGLTLIGIYLVSYLAEYLFFNKNSSNTQPKLDRLSQLRFLAFLLILNIVASLCNPYGYHLYEYISQYLFKSNAIIMATDEFLSPVFHGALQPGLLELLFALGATGLAITRRKMVLPDLLVLFLFAYLSLSAQRNMALFVIATLPIIGRLWSDTELNPAGGIIYNKLKPFWQAEIFRVDKLNERFSTIERTCTYHLLPICTTIVLVLIALNNGKVLGMQVLDANFDKNSKPSSTLAVIKQLNLSPYHGLALDNWGGILKYKLDYPVFIDDRADFYGLNFYMDYSTMILTSPGWQKVMTKHHIDWVLLPPNTRLTQELKTDPAWQIAAQDKGSLLLVRKEKATVPIIKEVK